MIQFAKELLTDALWAEAIPLLAAHYLEVAHFKDIPLDPDRALYAASEEAGILRVFTARDDKGYIHPHSLKLKPGTRMGITISPDPLVGYALYFVRPAPHYMGSVQAVQDVLYLAPAHRGRTAYKFVSWCDEQLSTEGVQAVYHHVKASKDFGPMLEHQGYELVDRIYAKRLDVPQSRAIDTTPDAGVSWRVQGQYDYDTARFVGIKP